MVIKGEMTYGTFLTFMAYMGMIYGPMFFFVDMSQWLSDAMNSMHRLMEIMDAEPEVSEPENPVRIEKFKGKVEFRNIGFYYEKKSQDNRRLSALRLNRERTIGIVGHSGAGKSTLANLLIRLVRSVKRRRHFMSTMSTSKISPSTISAETLQIVSQETYLLLGEPFSKISLCTSRRHV